jgi:DnaJ-class molecular chaperone
MTIHTEKEIIICNLCNGEGYKREIEYKSERDSEVIIKKCNYCNGTGRLVKTTIIEAFEGKLK